MDDHLLCKLKTLRFDLKSEKKGAAHSFHTCINTVNRPEK